MHAAAVAVVSIVYQSVIYSILVLKSPGLYFTELEGYLGKIFYREFVCTNSTCTHEHFKQYKRENTTCV